jgi:uncharacterized membrane protein YbhN (UPF0104 family)
MTGGNSRKRIWVRTVALSLTGFALLALLVWWVDPSRVGSVLSNADTKWIGLMLMALVAATLLGAINSYLIAIRDSELNFMSFLGAYWCAWAFGQVVPGQVGDLIGISLFLRRRGIALPTAVGRLGVDKLISLFCLLALSGGLMAIYNMPAPRLAGLLGVCAACALLGAYLLSLRWTVVSISGDGLRGKFMRVLREAHVVIKTRPLVIAVNLALTLFKLFLIGFCYWATFRAFHVAATSLIDVTVTANSAGLVAYVPISANGVGTVEVSAVYLFGLLGVAPPVVIAAYLTLRVASLALAFGGAALVLFFSAMFA